MLLLTCRYSCRGRHPVSWIACKQFAYSQNTNPPTPSLSNSGLQNEEQAPNRAIKWSKRQRERSEAMNGPRFVNVDLTAQPRPAAAIELLKLQAVQRTESRSVSCDGGGALGHPKIFINLDDSITVHSCGYCGKRFQRYDNHSTGHNDNADSH